MCKKFTKFKRCAFYLIMALGAFLFFVGMNIWDKFKKSEDKHKPTPDRKTPDDLVDVQASVKELEKQAETPAAVADTKGVDDSIKDWRDNNA